LLPARVTVSEVRPSPRPLEASSSEKLVISKVRVAFLPPWGVTEVNVFAAILTISYSIGSEKTLKEG